MTLAFIKDPSYIKRDTSPVDWLGLGMLTAGLAALQYVLERGQREDWFSSETIVIMSVVSAVSLISFVDPRSCATRNPLVDLSVFRSRSSPPVTSSASSPASDSTARPCMIPLYFQNIMGFDAIDRTRAAARARSRPRSA